MSKMRLELPVAYLNREGAYMHDIISTGRVQYAARQSGAVPEYATKKIV